MENTGMSRLPEDVCAHVGKRMLCFFNRVRTVDEAMFFKFLGTENVIRVEETGLDSRAAANLFAARALLGGRFHDLTEIHDSPCIGSRRFAMFVDLFQSCETCSEMCR